MWSILAHAGDLVPLIAQNWTVQVETGCSTRLFAWTNHLLDIMARQAPGRLEPVVTAAH